MRWSKGREPDDLLAAYDECFSITALAASRSDDPVGRFTSETIGRSNWRGKRCLAESAFCVIPLHTALFSKGCLEFLLPELLALRKTDTTFQALLESPIILHLFLSHFFKRRVTLLMEYRTCPIDYHVASHFVASHFVASLDVKMSFRDREHFTLLILPSNMTYTLMLL